MGAHVKATGLSVHTFFKEMHERDGHGTGDTANMIPEGYTMQLRFFRQVSHPGLLRPPAPQPASRPCTHHFTASAECVTSVLCAIGCLSGRRNLR